jgi:outer membrane lipoprotein-sorting protein
VLDLVAKTYAGCRSYRDSGVVRTVFVRDKGRRIVEKTFRTAFVRPDRFRFEFEENGDRYIVWRDRDEVLSWWHVKPGVSKVSSLGLALAGATGVSGGSAHTVPALLLPSDVTGWRVTELGEATRIDDARIDEVDCFRIAGSSAGSPHILWIDQKTYLVRRIEEGNRFDEFRTEETTDYDSVLDGEVPDESLRFDPPKEK